MSYITPRQLEVFDAIKSFIAQHGYAPSYAEIGQMAGIRSLGSVHKIVHRLQLAGRITLAEKEGPHRMHGRARSIQIGAEGQVCCPKCRHSFVVTRD